MFFCLIQSLVHTTAKSVQLSDRWVNKHSRLNQKVTSLSLICRYLTLLSVLFFFSDECGIVAQISQPLADSDISAYYISTFSFDHALVSHFAPFFTRNVLALCNSRQGINNVLQKPHQMQWIHMFRVIKVPDHPVCVYFAIMICWHSVCRGLSSLPHLYLVHLNHLWYLCDAEQQEDRKQKNSRIWSDWTIFATPPLFISMMSCEIRSSGCPCFLFLSFFPGNHQVF